MNSCLHSKFTAWKTSFPIVVERIVLAHQLAIHIVEHPPPYEIIIEYCYFSVQYTDEFRNMHISNVKKVHDTRLA